MKILYISNYRDQSGYSEAARCYIEALRAVGVSVASRSIKLTPSTGELSESVLASERASTDDCDVVIQHTLPNFFEYDGRFRKNIGLFHLETDRIIPSWVRSCNLMDEIWVSCSHNKRACLDSGVIKPIKVVPIPADTSKYERSYPKAHFRQNLPEDFIFYTVGEFNKRKNLEAIVRAFHGAFRPEEPVQLLIKSSVPGATSEQTMKALGDFCTAIKEQMGIYPEVSQYKKELLVPDQLSKDHIASLHISCDCFVSASYGEAWCLPAVDALGFGRNVIVPYNTAFWDHFTEQNSYLIPCNDEPCFGYPGVEMYGSRYNWYAPDITAMSTAMFQTYHLQKERKYKTENAVKTPYLFNYDKVGNLMKDILLNDRSVAT